MQRASNYQSQLSLNLLRISGQVLDCSVLQFLHLYHKWVVPGHFCHWCFLVWWVHLLNIRAKHLKRMLFRFCWNTCLTVLSTCDYSIKNLATVNFLTVQTWVKNGYFRPTGFTHVPFYSHHGSSWEGFPHLILDPPPPKGKLGEQGRFLSVEFHWLYGFLCRNSPSSCSRISDNIDED